MNISVIIFSQIVNHKADTCKKTQKNLRLELIIFRTEIYLLPGEVILK